MVLRFWGCLCLVVIWTPGLKKTSTAEWWMWLEIWHSYSTQLLLVLDCKIICSLSQENRSLLSLTENFNLLFFCSVRTLDTLMERQGHVHAIFVFWIGRQNLSTRHRKPPSKPLWCVVKAWHPYSWSLSDLQHLAGCDKDTKLLRHNGHLKIAQTSTFP